MAIPVAVGLLSYMHSKYNRLSCSSCPFRGESTSDEGSERASAVRGGGKSALAKTITDAGADAAKSFTDGRAANRGAGQDVSGQTPSDPEAQSTDNAVSNVIPVGWVPAKCIRLLVADENAAARTGLRGMLESQPDFEVIGEATTTMDVIQLTERLHPKVVLMDLHISEVDATEAIAEIRAKHPDIHTLVLTTYDSDADLLAAIEAGASGYLLKDTPRDELYKAIRTAAQGTPLPLVP